MTAKNLSVVGNEHWELIDTGYDESSGLYVDSVRIHLDSDACSRGRLIVSHYRPVTKLHMPRETTDIEPEDVANAILFLGSDESKMINGACLPVDRAWGVI